MIYGLAAIITVVWFVEKYTSVLKLWTSAFWLYFCTNITHFYFYKIKSIFVTGGHTLFLFVYIINFIEIQLIHEIPRFIRTFSSSRTNFPSFIELISTCPDVENYHFQNYRLKSTSISYWFSPILYWVFWGKILVKWAFLRLLIWLLSIFIVPSNIFWTRNAIHLNYFINRSRSS